MKIKALISTLAIVTSMLLISCNDAPKIASQAWTFKEFTLEETLLKLNELGIPNIELYPGQKISINKDETTHFKMDKETQESLKGLLQKYNIKAVSYGVVDAKSEEEWEQLFQFAKNMGIGRIVTEPDFDQLEVVDKLCQKYEIYAALHNHPTPTPYWDPKITLNSLEGKSEYMGVCADVGHWTRSGLDAVECLKILEGRLLEIHFKDVNTSDKTGHCVIWGEGVINMPGVLNELKRQKFDGEFVIEYEYNWNNSVPDIKKSLENFMIEYSKL